MTISGRVYDQQGARADAAHHLGHGLRLLAQRERGGVRRPGQQAHRVPAHPRGGLPGKQVSSLLKHLPSFILFSEPEENGWDAHELHQLLPVPRVR